MHAAVIKLLDEVKQLWMVTNSLNAFTGWPDDLAASNSAPNRAPDTEKIVAWQMLEDSKTSPLVHAAQQAAFHVIGNLSILRKKLAGIFLIIMPILS